MSERQPLASRPGRGGITVDERGTQGSIGFWPQEFDESKNAWVGNLRQYFGEAVRIAQKRHFQNQEVALAKSLNRLPVVPEPNVRQSLARAEQKKLTELEAKVSAIANEAKAAKMKLQPFPHFKDSTLAEAMQRQEMRALLRSMDENKRAELVAQKYLFRGAALEVPPELSGLHPEIHARLT
jgi:hypothetical protein